MRQAIWGCLSKKIDSAVSLTPPHRIWIRIPRRIEVVWENTSGVKQQPIWRCLMKKPREKSRQTIPIYHRLHKCLQTMETANWSNPLVIVKLSSQRSQKLQNLQFTMLHLGKLSLGMACVHPNTVSNILYVSTCHTLITYKYTLYNNHWKITLEAHAWKISA